MDCFPETLKPDSDLSTLRQKYVLRKLREKVFYCIASDNVDNFCDLTDADFSLCGDIKPLVNQVCSELHLLGWKTKLTYGDTALFVFASNKQPKFCW